MTNQEMFDKMCQGLRAQGWQQSRNDFAKCSYRGKDGLKCAAGHLMPDDVYQTAFDLGNATVSMLPERVRTAMGVDSGNLLFVSSAQSAHDGGYLPEEMVQRFKILAKQYSLDDTEAHL